MTAEMSIAQRKQRYEADGILHVPSMLNATQLAETLAELDRYVAAVVPNLAPHEIVWEATALPDGSRRIRNLWHMEHHSEFFDRLSKRPDILELASALVNGDPVLMAVELFAKPARVGSAVPYHQDNAYFNLAPPDSFTCWISLDASTEENGCVYYCLGSHRAPAWPHIASGVTGNSMKADQVSGPMEEAAGILAPGDAMIHHCMTLHRSEPNASGRERRGLLLVYKGAHCGVDHAGAAHYAAVRAGATRSATPA